MRTVDGGGINRTDSYPANDPAQYPLLTTREAAECLNLTPDAVRRLARRGGLRFVQIRRPRGAIRFGRLDVRRLRQERDMRSPNHQIRGIHAAQTLSVEIR
ncbi:MAG: helix-turn-helix domain-containing protein [Chloroflexi bacterium]|nr:helix-turn-helix domain-containing protein [Chloroflexota bacterium]